MTRLKTIGRRIAAGVAAISIGGALGWAGSQIYDYALTSKAFAIRTIEIEGLQRADRQTLLSLGGIREGDNVLAVDTDEAAARIKRHPWIDEVDVTRRPPQR